MCLQENWNKSYDYSAYFTLTWATENLHQHTPNILRAGPTHRKTSNPSVCFTPTLHVSPFPEVTIIPCSQIDRSRSRRLRSVPVCCSFSCVVPNTPSFCPGTPGGRRACRLNSRQINIDTFNLTNLTLFLSRTTLQWFSLAEDTKHFYWVKTYISS